MTCRKVVRSRHYYYTQCDIYVNTPRTHTHTLTQPENIDTIRNKLKIIRKKEKKKFLHIDQLTPCLFLLSLPQLSKINL